MKNLMILAAVLLLSGCGLTYDCERETRGVGAHEAFAMLAGHDVTLVLHDYSRREGHVVRLSSDTLELLQKNQESPLIVTIDQIRSASVHKSGVGPSILGGLFGSTSGQPDSDIDIAFGPAGSGNAIVVQQRGLVLSFQSETKMTELIGGGAESNASRQQPEQSNNPVNASRNGNHR